MTGKKKAASSPSKRPVREAAEPPKKAPARKARQKAAAPEVLLRKPEPGSAAMERAVHDVMHPPPAAARAAARKAAPQQATPLEAPSRSPKPPEAAPPKAVAQQAPPQDAVPPDAAPSGQAADEPARQNASALSARLASGKDQERDASVAAAEPTAAAPPPAAEPAAKPQVTAPAAKQQASDHAAKPQASPAPVSSPLPLPDFERLSHNMTRLMEESGKLAASYYQRDPAPLTVKADVADAVQTLGQVAEHWFGDPARFIQAQTALTTQFFDLWASSAKRAAGAPDPAPAAKPADKRFSDPEWRENPVYDFVHKAYLLGSNWANALIEQADLDDATREKARFYMRLLTSAMSPSNFVPTNPELLRETLKENGGNLLRGMKMLAEDIAAGNGQLRIRHTDTSKFEVGVNMATTPGKVVFRNDLMELLQYSPSTPEVLARPLLIVPPWINKFYVLDLNPEKSFIRWAVAQGLTVFLISWVNPDERHAAKDFEAYMREGILTALDEVGAITGHPDATAIGYCVGGTLLAVTLAHMAAVGDHRISSATLFTAQVDFSYAGDLKVFADESQIASVEQQMRDQGFLRGSHMAQAFNMLRPEELIWSYVVNNYLKGKEPKAFDLLAWNSDSTRMPAANHSFYLRNCYLENKLARGLMEIAGAKLDLGKVTIPIYNLATREDHIAPAVSVFEGCQYFGGPVRYVLSGSGHVAGVVNPPDKVKYGYTLGGEPRGTLEGWLKDATTHPGSWWPDWFEWVKAQAPATVPAREPGGGRAVLGDAPGTYVRVKA